MYHAEMLVHVLERLGIFNLPTELNIGCEWWFSVKLSSSLYLI